MALTFLAAALVLVMDNINSVIFLRRSELAKAVFGERRIEITLAGLLLVAVANFMTIISYGLYKDSPVRRQSPIHSSGIPSLVTSFANLLT
jgi:hypothetical protein